MPTFKHRSTRIERTFEISDGEDIPGRWGATYTIRPDLALVDFVDGRFQSMEIRGSNVKRDGTVGINRHTAAYCRSDAEENDIPGWLWPLTDFDFEG